MTASAEPRYARIAADLRRRIADGGLAPGQRVPSTRQLARDWGVALATAAKALDVLRSEGLVKSRPRSGTVVAEATPLAARGASAARELSLERIVEEAVLLADAEGLESVSMRAVASRCGVSAMSLYRHVDGKDRLVLLMAESAFAAETAASGDSGASDWRGRVERVMRSLWRVHRAHPWLAQISPLSRPLSVPSLTAAGETILKALGELRLPAKQHFDAHVLLYNHVVGLAVNVEREHKALAETGMSADEWVRSLIVPAMGVTAGSPRASMHAELFGPAGELSEGYDFDWDELFESGLRIMIDGIEALARRVGDSGAPPG